MLDSPQVGAVPMAPTVSSWPGAATRVLVPLFATTLFLSSFLMFTVEPMVARQMLPVLGGVPMVWNGCVVFFQAVLLAGYGGAHLLTQRLAAPVRLLVYAGLAVLPVAFVRLGVDAASASHASQAPLSWLLVALLTSVGPLFLVLAVSASVLQSTFASTSHESARDPYFLYAASNAGSLVALMAYPTVIEPLLALSQQARVWTIGYGLFVLFVLACAVAARFALTGRAAAAPRAAAESPTSGEAITWTRRARWCVLAAVPSSLMLGVTTALTTDIAPVPLLWVAPLALYLLTFIAAFGKTGERWTGRAARALPVLLLAVSASLLLDARPPIIGALLLHLVPFLAAAMFCHGLLARDRPSPRHLTEFYFWLAFGGMAGGLFNTLLAPVLFSRILEYPLALAAVAFLRPQEPARGAPNMLDLALPVAAVAIAGFVVFRPWPSGNGLLLVLAVCTGLTWLRRRQAVTLATVAGVFLIASPWASLATEPTFHAERTFYGTYRVSTTPGSSYVALKMGTTLHGLQNTAPGRLREPLSYYHHTGPFGHLMAGVPRMRQPGAVAAIGLGVGTLSAYAWPRQEWTFFEIDPAVERIARDDRYFSFLTLCGGRCRVVLGDARLSLVARPDARYHLIVLDAFSSDAIPVHLITQDAMAVYLSRLAPGGVLAFHVSNRHLTLSPIVGRLARHNGLVAREFRDRPAQGMRWARDKAQSWWVMMARSPEDLGALMRDARWTEPQVTPATPLWTDDFSNVFSVLKLGRF
jgi:hypothetical protein